MHVSWLLGDCVPRNVPGTLRERIRLQIRAFSIPGVMSRWIFSLIFVYSLAVPLLLLCVIYLPLPLEVVGVIVTLWLSLIASLNLALRPSIRFSLRASGYEVCRKCGHLLTNVSLVVTHCPKCATWRDLPKCYRCGYSLLGCKNGSTRCTECGTDQLTMSQAWLQSWLSVRYIDPRIVLLWREKIRVHWHAAWSAKLVLATAFLMTGVLLTLLVVIGNSILYTSDTSILALLMVEVPVLVFLFLVSFLVIGHIFYGPSLRRAVREAGHDVCLACGYLQRAGGDGPKRCPLCGSEETARRAT